MSGRLGLVFVHGILSSADTWSPFLSLIEHDASLDFLAPSTFSYTSPPISLNPLRRIPDINDIADSLRTYLTNDLADVTGLVLVAHSQGGLVVQRMLARTLADGRGSELARIRRIVLFACPNSGSELALLLRRGLLGWHSQERDLRPLNRDITEAHRVVLNQIIHATSASDGACPIRIIAYAGESDGVVTPTSAKSVFPEVGVLPGDHFSIIKPDSTSHRSYAALKRNLMEARSAEVPERAPRPGAPPGIPAARPAADLYRVLVDGLLAVPRMTEPAFRDQIYDLLPPVIIHQMRRDNAARIELFSLLRSFEHYRHLAPWDSLAMALETLVPDHPAVADVLDNLASAGLRKA
ncbi:alpha/beta fold hydrolase [Actinoplanes sp. M2I2]|uniref:alpha/beta fold hydrolase n=1 Tax=Actinoplanes sp. M2I2 TaxID=1734444 RepID=UPI0020214CC9|nr:alpha/beta fold hydrolase [Actinoplanes sp. M2I2]